MFDNSKNTTSTEFPKCLTKGEETVIVADKDEQAAAEKDGFAFGAKKASKAD